MLQDLLRGDYQSVYDNFMIRYGLNGDYELCSKLKKKLEKIDRDVRFENKQQEGLYKLQIIYRYFFTESLGINLTFDMLQMQKGNPEISRCMEELVEGEE